MPGPEGLRLPIVERSVEDYEGFLRECGFTYESEDIFPSAEVLNKKPGLRKAGGVPVALLFNCRKAAS